MSTVKTCLVLLLAHFSIASSKLLLGIDENNTELSETSVANDGLHEKVDAIFNFMNKSLEQCQVTVQNVANTSNIVEIYTNLSEFENGTSEREEEFVDYVIMSLNVPGKLKKTIEKFNKVNNPIRFIKRIVREVLENPKNLDQFFEFLTHIEDITTKYITAWAITDQITINRAYNDVKNLLKLLQSIVDTDEFASFSEFDQKNGQIMISRMKREIEMENRLELTKMSFDLQQQKLNIRENFNKILKIGQETRLFENRLIEENDLDLKALKAQFPDYMHLLLSEGCVTIFSNRAQEFIYAHKDVLKNGEKLYSQSRKMKDNNGFKWAFEQDSSNSTYFYIKNLGTQEYLYATNEEVQHNHDLRRLQLSSEKKNVNSFKWFLLPDSQPPFHYVIVNVALNKGIFVYQSDRIYGSSEFTQHVISEC